MRRSGLLALVLLAAACSGSSKAATPSATVTTPPTSSTTTTSPQTVEQQVEAAYLHSWDVYATAVRTLDPSGLSESFVPPQLDTLTKEVNERIRQRRPAQVSVEHNLSVRVVDSTTAVIRDDYVNHSVRLDPVTGQPTETPPNDHVSVTNTLKLVEAKWKITFVVQQR